MRIAPWNLAYACRRSPDINRELGSRGYSRRAVDYDEGEIASASARLSTSLVSQARDSESSLRDSAEIFRPRETRLGQIIPLSGEKSGNRPIPSGAVRCVRDYRAHFTEVKHTLPRYRVPVTSDNPGPIWPRANARDSWEKPSVNCGNTLRSLITAWQQAVASLVTGQVLDVDNER